MKLLYQLEVQDQEVHNQRIYDYLHAHSEVILSRKAIKKRFSQSLIELNGERAFSGDYVKKGDSISIYDSANSKPVYSYNLDVHFEDEYLAIITKPAGILVNGNSFRTVENALPYNLSMSSLADGLHFSQAAHRLDYPTSGLLLVGKTRSSVIATKHMFADRQIKKIYHAVTLGNMPTEGHITTSIDDKHAETSYKIIKSSPSKKYGQFNLVELSPKTGRKHQLRKHLSGIGFPILGDRMYGEELHWQMKKGLYLCSTSLEFIHPFTNQALEITIDIPKKFIKLLSRG